jgi:hypothetical protein
MGVRLTKKERELLGFAPRARKPSGGGSGYVQCACRDCMEIAISSGGKKRAFCSGCRDAGCPDYQGQPGMSQECQRPDAYGG